MVRRSGKPVDRETVRPPFCSQCYVAAPFALGFGFAGTLSQLHWAWAGPAALAVGGAALVWYGMVQVGWFRRCLAEGAGRAFVDASIAMVECVAMLGGGDGVVWVIVARQATLDKLRGRA